LPPREEPVSYRRRFSAVNPKPRVKKATAAAQLRRLADEVLEAADAPGLTRLLTRKLPAVLGVEEATLLLWDRKLDTFEGLTPAETQAHPVWPGGL
jgi:hypothetical protein